MKSKTPFLFSTSLIVLLSIIFFSTSNAQPWYKAGLVAHYPLNGMSLVDSSANAAHLTQSQNLNSVQNRHSAAGMATAFPAATSFMSGPSSHLPSGAQARTFSIWIYVLQLQTPQGYSFPFFYGERQELKGMGLGITSGGQLVFAGYRNAPGNTYADLESIGTIGEIEWVHVGMSYDGDTAKLYINGQLDNTGLKAWNTTPDKTLHVGRMGYSPGSMTGGATVYLPYGGIIDDFRVYDRELTAEEIFKLSQDDFSALAGSGVGVSEHDMAEVAMYPNPAHREFALDGFENTIQVKVISAAGKVMISKEVSVGETINVAGWAKGLYALEIIQGNKRGYRKLVVR